MPAVLYYLECLTVFCLLWMPLFYLFWRTVAENDSPAGGVWALIAGSLVAMIQFFLGNLTEPGGFGVSRWVSGFVDIVALPVLAPILIYLFLAGFKIVSGTIDFANFTLLWLIPGAAIRTLSWSSLNDPILLILVPLLWTAIAVGISFFIGIIQKSRLIVIIPSVLAILVIPFAAVCSYWAFYTQKVSLGFLFFSAAAVPMLVSLVLSFIRSSGD